MNVSDSGVQSSLADSNAWKKHMVLAVDDEEAILAYIKSTLMLAGFSVIAAKSGEEGLELLKSNPVKLVISDQMMPGGMLGTQFLCRAKELYPDIITVILSAYKDSDHVIAALNEAKTFYYLTKPCEKDELINRVSQALNYYHAGFLKRQQEQLAHAVMMETEKMANLGTYSGGIAHNLRNMIFPLVAYFDGIRQDMEDIIELNKEKSSSEVFEERSHSILQMSDDGEKAIEEVTSLIESLMSLYRSKSNEPEPFDLAQVIENAIRLEKTRKESKGIQIHFDKKGTDFQIEALRGLMSSVIVEFLKNASYAIGERDGAKPGESPAGNIWITLDAFQDKNSGEAVRFSIKDDGCGISDEVQKQVFVPLFTTKARVGTGLGLSAAHEIIHAHNGSITLESAPGAGTTFTVTLPKKPKDAIEIKSL